jgi:hypothetical protein
LAAFFLVATLLFPCAWSVHKCCTEALGVTPLAVEGKCDTVQNAEVVHKHFAQKNAGLRTEEEDTINELFCAIVSFFFFRVYPKC